MPETLELKIPLDRMDAVHCPHCRRRVHTGTWPLLSTVPCPYCARPLTVPGKLGPFGVTRVTSHSPVAWVLDGYDPQKDNLPVWLVVARIDHDDKPRFDAFVKQTKALARSRHPNLVRVLSLGQSKGLLYTVLQAVPGQPLSTLLEAARDWSEPQVLQLAIDVVQGLAEAAARGATHGDLTPDHILLTPDGHALVMGFGLDLVGQPLTDAGKLWCSPLYLSPEKATGKPGGVASDLYSLGAILYHLFAGRPPFQEPHRRDTVVARLKAPPPPLIEFRELSGSTLQIIDRLLATHPEDRYGDYDALLSDLCATAGIEAAAPEAIPGDSSGSVAFFDADAVEDAAAVAAEDELPELVDPFTDAVDLDDAAPPRVSAPRPRRRRRRSILPTLLMLIVLLGAIIAVVVLIMKSPALNPPPVKQGTQGPRDPGTKGPREKAAEHGGVSCVPPPWVPGSLGPGVPYA